MQILFYGESLFDDGTNTATVKSYAEYILAPKHFEALLFDVCERKKTRWFLNVPCDIKQMLY